MTDASRATCPAIFSRLLTVLFLLIFAASICRAQTAEEIRETAQNGDADAQGILSVLLQIDALAASEGASRPEQAREFAEKSAEVCSPFGRYALGRFYGEGVGGQKDEEKAKELYGLAFPQLLKLAEAGNANAQWIIGVCCETSRGTKEDKKLAVAWYRKSADRGNHWAQSSLGRSYLDGSGVDKDPVEAAKWFRQSAEQDNPDAQRNLAWCYMNGEGVEKDKAEAVGWFRKSAEQGNADAQLTLGWCYAKGEGVAKNPAEAVKLYRQSAEQGNKQAMRNLAYMDDSGLDSSEKNLWIYRAAEAGSEFYGGPDTKEVMALTVGGQLRSGTQPPKGIFTMMKEALSGEFKTRRLDQIVRATPRKEGDKEVFPVRLVFEDPNGGEERWDLEFFKDDFGQWSASNAAP